VAERSAALECNGEKRKSPAAGFGRKTLHGLHLRRVVGLLWFFTTIMVIRKILVANCVGGACWVIFCLFMDLYSGDSLSVSYVKLFPETLIFHTHQNPELTALKMTTVISE